MTDQQASGATVGSDAPVVVERRGHVLMSSQDAAEGLRSFVERRPARFQGR